MTHFVLIQQERTDSTVYTVSLRCAIGLLWALKEAGLTTSRNLCSRPSQRSRCSTVILELVQMKHLTRGHFRRTFSVTLCHPDICV